jgi:hypothetical protein
MQLPKEPGSPKKLEGEPAGAETLCGKLDDHHRRSIHREPTYGSLNPRRVEAPPVSDDTFLASWQVFSQVEKVQQQVNKV